MLEITALRPSPTQAAARPDPARIRDAASQFEALLISQLLKSARESSTGWLSDGDDKAGSAATDLAEEHLAQSLARQGGLGLARMVISGLEARPTSR